jgi:hypothetical protein
MFLSMEMTSCFSMDNEGVMVVWGVQVGAVEGKVDGEGEMTVVEQVEVVPVLPAAMGICSTVHQWFPLPVQV